MNTIKEELITEEDLIALKEENERLKKELSANVEMSKHMGSELDELYEVIKGLEEELAAERNKE